MKKYLSDMEDFLLDWDFKRNQDVDITKVSHGSITKYAWKCHVCGYEWMENMNSRYSKRTGCPCCSNRIVVVGKNDVATTDPWVLKEWNYDRNEGITPYMFKRGSGKKVWWKCCKCGYEWQASIEKRTRGRGCPVCSGKKVLVGFNDIGTTAPELVEEWDYAKNIFSPYEVTAGSNKKVSWNCVKCGYQWDAVIASRVKGAGCPKCAIKKIIEKADERAIKNDNTLAEVFPKLAEEWHSSKNGKLSPKMVAPYSQKKVWWECSNCGNEWEGTISNRAKGRGCPECNYSRQSSFAEQMVYTYIKEQFPDVIRGYVCKEIYPYKLDIYLSFYKLGIEYDGERWHRDVKKDIEKDRVLFENGIKVIRIREKGCPVINDGCYVINTDQPDYEEYHYLLRTFEGLRELLNKLTGNMCLPIENLSLIKSEVARSYYDDLEKKSLSAYAPGLIEEWDFDANGNLKPEMVYPKSNKKVNWICKKCGYRWAAQVGNRVAGSGCPCCAGKHIVEGYNDFKSQHPELMKEWNYEKNEEIEPECLTVGNSNNPVWWRCRDCGHEWSTSIYNRTHLGSGCPKCAAKAIAVIVSRKISKKVVCITTGEHFDSQTSAAKAYGIGKSEIGKCCKGKQQTSGHLEDGTRLRWAYE
ncbi:MAG: hypothetical protein J6N21_19340 [Butyrivibrio sp.]|nr:hypothetical protein [Butyrivibrio sp.]